MLSPLISFLRFIRLSPFLSTKWVISLKRMEMHEKLEIISLLFIFLFNHGCDLYSLHFTLLLLHYSLFIHRTCKQTNKTSNRCNFCPREDRLKINTRYERSLIKTFCFKGNSINRWIRKID